MYAQPIVAVRRQKEFKLEDIVAVNFFGDQILSAADEDSILDLVGRPCPAGQVLAVKKANGLLGTQGCSAGYRSDYEEKSLHVSQLVAYFKSAWPIFILSLSDEKGRLVGVIGFEPTASCSQSRRSDQAELHPVLPERPLRFLIPCGFQVVNHNCESISCILRKNG